jgi:hypothetical protein
MCCLCRHKIHINKNSLIRENNIEAQNTYRKFSKAFAYDVISNYYSSVFRFKRLKNGTPE